MQDDTTCGGLCPRCHDSEASTYLHTCELVFGLNSYADRLGTCIPRRGLGRKARSCSGLVSMSTGKKDLPPGVAQAVVMPHLGARSRTEFAFKLNGPRSRPGNRQICLLLKPMSCWSLRHEDGANANDTGKQRRQIVVLVSHKFGRTFSQELSMHSKTSTQTM